VRFLHQQLAVGRAAPGRIAVRRRRQGELPLLHVSVTLLHEAVARRLRSLAAGDDDEQEDQETRRLAKCHGVHLIARSGGIINERRWSLQSKTPTAQPGRSLSPIAASTRALIPQPNALHVSDGFPTELWNPIGGPAQGVRRQPVAATLVGPRSLEDL